MLVLDFICQPIANAALTSKRRLPPLFPTTFCRLTTALVLAELISAERVGWVCFPFKILSPFSRYCWLGACLRNIPFVFPPATTAGAAHSGIEKTNLSELSSQIRAE